MNRLMDVARRNEPADLLIKGGRVVNVLTGEIYPAHVAVAGEWIAGVGLEYQNAREVLEIEGSFLIPGLINGHLHLESSFLAPAEYARLALSHGTTTLILDPHEIANVLGVLGIEALLEGSRGLPLDFFFMAPSCVPATALETAGAEIRTADIEKLWQDPRVLGLGEMMNFPGVIQQEPSVMEKLRAAQKREKPIDGHAPLLSGKDLNAYIAAGIQSDHECTRPEEAEEKLRLGMWLMIREGSAAKNLRDLLPVVSPGNHHRCLWVTDDLEPSELIQAGEIDYVIRKAVVLGLDPLMALRMATINPARRFHLKDRGAIAPGLRADLAVLSDFKKFQVTHTLKNGKVVARGSRTGPLPAPPFDPRVLRSVRMKPLPEGAFDLFLKTGRAWVIGLVPNQIVTRKLALPVQRDVGGRVLFDLQSDILKLAVIERHKASGRMGLGLIQGFGLKRGALAGSVAHDSHNIVVIGAGDADMLEAAQEIEKMRGGLVVVDGGKVIASLSLPIAGLMSPEPCEKVAAKMEELKRAARKIGALPENPFLTLSFLALPVIPELKLTDQGLVDVETFRIIPLEAD